MFRSFFLSKQWTLWAWPGVLLIVAGTWYQVQVNVMINEWFGGFYDLVQKALGQAEAVSLQEYYGFILTFGQIAGIYVIVAVVLSFYTTLFLIFSKVLFIPSSKPKVSIGRFFCGPI